MGEGMRAAEGKRLKEARLARGLSQQALSAMAGVSSTTVSKAEAGRPVSAETISALWQAMADIPEGGGACTECGTQITERKAKVCSPRCRNARGWRLKHARELAQAREERPPPRVCSHQDCTMPTVDEAPICGDHIPRFETWREPRPRMAGRYAWNGYASLGGAGGAS